MSERNILLCVAGATSQIITETLYVLTQERRITIDEIRVITTLDGRDKILTGVIKERGSAAESLLDKEKGQFFQFLRDFPACGAIRFEEKSISLLKTRDGMMLDDIRTPEENELAGDQICEIVRELTRNENTVIHASAAGGRKTMGIYLTAAMSLFGRADDTLSHVLVSEDFETNPQFFYKPPVPKIIKLRDGREVSTDAAEIYLADIPFIRLRGIGAKPFDENLKFSYKQMVDRAQTDLKLAESAYDLRFDFKNNLVKVADREVKLSLREIFVFVLFAYFRRENVGAAGFVGLHPLSREHLEAVCRIVSKGKGRERGFDDFGFLPRSEFLYGLNVASYRNKIEEKTGERPNVPETQEKITKVLREVLGKIEPKLRAVLPEEFLIERRGEKERFIFGLKIEPERIKFE